MGTYIYRTILIMLLLIGFTDAYSQCNINDRGTNLQVEANQYPYTVFYRNVPNGAFKYERNLNVALDSFRVNLRALVKNGKDDKNEEFDVVPFNIYKRLFDDAFPTGTDANIKAYGSSNREEERKEAFSFQLKNKAFVLLCATNDNGYPLGADSMQLLREELDEMFATISYAYPNKCNDCTFKESATSVV